MTSFLNRYEEEPAGRQAWAEAYYDYDLVVIPAFEQVDRAAADDDPEITRILRAEALSAPTERSQADTKVDTANKVVTVMSRQDRREKAQGATPVVISAASAEQLREAARLADIRHSVANAFGDAQNG